jgi:hypothetical protein
MRDKQTERTVRIASTGHAEGDMLGQVLMWVDKRQNSKFSQRPHKTYKRKSKLRVVSKWFQTAPTACWRRLKSLISFSNRYGRKLASVMRRKRINGK